MSVGPVLGADTTIPATGRQTKTGDAAVSQCHGKYYEPASRGVLFCASDAGAGVATVTSISTTAIASLYNPVNSGKRLAIKKVRVGYFSGTLGAGPIYHAVNPAIAGIALPAVPSAGTSQTVYCTDAGNQSGAAAVGLFRTGSTVTAPKTLSPICSVGAELASTANGLQQASDDVDGEIVVEPGYCYQIQSVCAAGSTPLVTVGVTWEEVPIVATQG